MSKYYQYISDMLIKKSRVTEHGQNKASKNKSTGIFQRYYDVSIKVKIYDFLNLLYFSYY
jgi:hypothetical protein